MNLLYLMVSLPLITFGQETSYNISSFINQDLALEKKAPNTHYIGNAWLSSLVRADDDFNYNITLATFGANSTLDWHKHKTSQVLVIVEGSGYYQEKGKDVRVVNKGDVIKCDKDIEHWHSSTHDSMVSYLAIYGASQTQWTDKLTKEVYDKIKVE